MSADFLFGSEVRGDDGRLKMMFRGDYRADALASGFKIIEMEDGGSGGLFFTDNPAVASSYADNKPYQDEAASDAWRFINVTFRSHGKARVMPLAKANLWLTKVKK